MGWKAERYPQDHQQVADHRIVDGDKVIAFCPTGYPFENVELMAMAPALLRVVRAAERFYEILEPWSRAYPEDVFIPPPAGEHGKTVDACSAAMGRHILGKLMEDFAETLEALEALEALLESLRHE